MRTRTIALLSMLSFSTAAAACAPGDDGDSSDLAGSGVQDLVADAKKVKTDDFGQVLVTLATEDLNKALAVASWEPPTVYSANGEPNALIPSKFQVKSINQIRQTIAGEFGERELAAEVQKIRLDQIQQGKAKFFIESGARVGGLKGTWSASTGGFDGDSVKVGFDVGDQRITRIVVAADDRKVGTLLETVGQATKELRSFIEPRNADDLRALKPGEMIALRSRGGVAGNIGASTPLFVTDPAGLALKIVFTAGVSFLINGEFHDTQVVKLNDDEAVIDIGMEHAESARISAQIRDQWGIKGLCDGPGQDGGSCLRTTNVGGKDFDLKAIAERAAARTLNNFTGVRIGGFAENKKSHVTLQRFRIHLNRGNRDEVNKAVELAMVGDLRAAQAMATRDEGKQDAPIKNEFDATRAATTTTRSFGFGIFGFNIFNFDKQKSEGIFELRTPEGETNIAFKRVHRAGGFFGGRPETNHVGLAAQIIDATHPDDFKSEANLLIQTITKADPVGDDRIEDNIDGTLLALGGADVINALEGPTTEMTKLVWSSCSFEDQNQNNRRRIDVDCNKRLITNDPPSIQGQQMKGLRDAALDAGNDAVARLAPSSRTLAGELVKSRVAFAQVGTEGTGLPEVSYTVDVRLDDKALNELTSKSKQQYIDSVKKFVATVKGDRSEFNPKDRAAILRGIDDGEIAKAATAFEQRALRYRGVVAMERDVADRTRARGYKPGAAVEVVLDQKQSAGELVKSAELRSPSRERAAQVEALFSDLREASKDIDGVPHEWIATYSLLSLVPQDNLAVAVGMFQKDLGDRFRAAGFTEVTKDAVGPKVSPISTDFFDLDAVIRGPVTPTR
jgi:hypothetical protein